jgi:predicted NBD/HSP70 family sugar kinase/biotin operon repressor
VRQATTSESIAVRSAVRLRDEGPATLTDLAKALDISRTSVENAVSALADRGLVHEVHLVAHKGAGRPARRYAFSADSGGVAGIDIGNSQIRIVIADLAGSVRSISEFPGLTDGDGAEKLAAVVEALRAALHEADFPIEQLRALGLSVPGLIGADGHLITSSIVPEWSGVDVAGRLRDTIGCPVTVDNDVRLAAIAEHHLGAGQLVDDMLYVSVGRRISMGLVLGGRARRGVHNAAGEVGHLAFGDLDDETGGLPWRSAQTAEEVFDRARSGDADAQAELDLFVRRLGRGVSTLALTVDPALIVVGGGLSLAGERLTEPLRAEIQRIIRLPIELPVVPARLGAASSAYGALVHAFTRHSASIYGLAEIPTPRIPVSA